MAASTLSPQMMGYRAVPGQYYKHSGGLNPAGVLAGLVVGALAAVAMAIPYAFLVRYIPFVKLSAAACVFYGIAMGAVPAAIMKRMKVRSVPAGLLVCAIVGAVGLYASWVIWEAVILGDRAEYTVWQRAVNPAAVARFAERINGQGTWSMGHSYSSSRQTNDSVSGTFLSLIWAAEAGILVVAPVVIGVTALKSTPFCDACDAWCDKKTLVRSTDPVDAKLLRQKLESGDFAFVAGLAAPGSQDRLEFANCACGKCGRLNALTVTRKSTVRDKKGRVKKNSSAVIVNKLLVSPADLEQMRPAVPTVSAGATAPPVA